MWMKRWTVLLYVVKNITIEKQCCTTPGVKIVAVQFFSSQSSAKERIGWIEKQRHKRKGQEPDRTGQYCLLLLSSSLASRISSTL